MSARRILAWGVHAYTGLGLVAAAAIALCIIDGSPAGFRAAFLWMAVAVLIDATDGTFARLVKVKEVLPGFDGRRLDDIVDFQTYTSLPLLLIWRAGLVPEGQAAWLLAPLAASAYGFCQVHAKTDDGYFLGFPSYWNIIAFYLYVLDLPPAATVTVLVFFAVMTFVPARYLYPTHRGRLNQLTCLLGALWGALVLAIVLQLPRAPLPEGATAEDAERFFTMLSLVFPIFYLGVSWWISLRIALRVRHVHAAHSSSRSDH